MSGAALVVLRMPPSACESPTSWYTTCASRCVLSMRGTPHAIPLFLIGYSSAQRLAARQAHRRRRLQSVGVACTPWACTSMIAHTRRLTTCCLTSTAHLFLKLVCT